MSYKLRWHRSAYKALKKIPTDVYERLMPKISALSENARPHYAKKLKGFSNTYRIRVGDWRIVYVVKDDEELVEIRDVGPRGSVYKRKK